MEPTPLRGVRRASSAAVGCATATAALCRLGHDAVTDLEPATASPDELVAVVAVGLGAAAGAALTLGCVLLVVAALGGPGGTRPRRAERWAARLTPALLRRVVAVGVGAGIGLGGVGGAAVAEEVDVGWEVTGTGTVVDATAPAPGTGAPGPGAEVEAQERATEPVGADTAAEPDPAATPAAATLEAPAGPAGAAGSPPAPGTAPPQPSPPDAAAAPRPEPAVEPGTAGRPGAGGVGAAGTVGTADTARTVVVRPGDCLWDITAALLPPGSPDADVAAAWPLLYASNRGVIGADPDVVHPGQALVVPEGLPA